MKITLLSALFFLTAVLANAQKQAFGIKAGPSLTNVSAAWVEDNQPRIGFAGGFTYDRFLKENFSLGLGVLYSQRGYTITPILRDYMGREREGSEKIRYDYDYLSVPFNAGFYTGKRLYGFANIGIIPSVLVNGKFIYPVYEGAGTSFRVLTQDVAEFVKKLDVAGSVEIGAGVRLGDRMSMYASSAFQHSITTFTDEDHFDESNTKHNGCTFFLGLKYSSGKSKL